MSSIVRFCTCYTRPNIPQVQTEEDGSIVQNASYSRLFDVRPLLGVNLDTYVKQSGLSLTQGKTYQVVVIATDEAGGCAVTSGVFTVDTTPPEGGHLGVGPEGYMVSYGSVSSQHYYSKSGQYLVYV